MTSMRAQIQRQRWVRVILWFVGLGLIISSSACTNNNGTKRKASSSATASASSSSTESNAPSDSTSDAVSISPTGSDEPEDGTSDAPGKSSVSPAPSKGSGKGNSSGGSSSDSDDSGINQEPADISLDNQSTCSLSQHTVLHIVKAQGWVKGPYTTQVFYSATADGSFKKSPVIDWPSNTSPNASPADGWKWPCREPQSDGSYKDDPIGHYKVVLVDYFTGEPKSENFNFVVVP